MKVFAHRGASGEYPENSLIAFEQAILQEADGIELDAQYHACGHWWLLHDLYVDKTTNGSGRLLAMNETNIKALTTAANQPLVSLPQALSVIGKQCAINIEVKISTGDENKLSASAAALKNLLVEAVAANQCDWMQFSISSFNHLFLQSVSRIMPQMKLGALIAHCPVNLAEYAADIGAASLNLSIDCLNKKIINDAHKRGLEAWVYTVDRFEDIAYCHSIGVDAIFSNYPAKAKAFIKSIT